MANQFKVYNGASFVKDKAMKKCPELKHLAIAVKATNKEAAAAIIYDKLAEFLPEHNEQRKAMTQRLVEVAHAINDLLSGHTNIMDKKEAESIISCTGHLISHIAPMLIDTIITTESFLSPAFSDEEIHDTATTILDAWSDNEAERVNIATDAIVKYRSQPELPQPAVIDPPVITAKPKKADEHASQKVRNVMQPVALTYQQQLTIAALHGLCANPVHGNALDDLPAIAADLASGIIRLQKIADV